MNTENVKRSIQIEEIKDDIFSDEIKTAALIEEIEAAEVAARQANIDRQIESSQPTRIQRLQIKISRKAATLKDALTEKLADLKEKQPEDPRVKKVSFKKKVSAKIKKAEKAKKPAKNQNWTSRINALMPQGLSKKTVVELSVAAALIVAGAEIWAWNLSHPLFPAKDAQEISVPVTGNVESAEIDDDSPFADTSTTEENKADKTDAEEHQDNAAENTANLSTGVKTYNYSSNRGQSTTTLKRNTSTSSNNRTKNYSGSTTVDGSWNDSYDSNWPTYEEPGEPVPAPSDNTPVQPSEGDSENTDAAEEDGTEE